MTIYTIPRANAPIAGQLAPTTQWYNFLRYLDSRGSGAAGDVQVEIETIATKLGSPDGTVAGIPPLGNVSSVQGEMSIASSGIGVVQLRLVNDVDSVDPVYYYGTDSAGAKGWHPVFDAFAGSANIAGTNTLGIVSFDLTDVTVGAGGSLLKYGFDAKGRLNAQDSVTATDLPYDNTTSGMAATEVQAAVDELAAGNMYGATSTSATTGSAVALPALPAGYITVIIAGVAKKIPYYDV